MYQTYYYVIYSVVCAVLVIGLSQVLHHAGEVFLQDSFKDNPALARGVTRLLDVGYYLVCVGYFTITIRTHLQLSNIAEVTEPITVKVGIFLLLLGGMHFFNLLLLAIFRRRTGAAAVTSGA
jgi:hypothetical protein